MHKPNDITRATVRALAEFLPQRIIARHMKIDEKTLRKHYREELDNASCAKHIKVLNCLYLNATDNMNVAAQIWYTKAMIGLTDKAEEVSEEDKTGEAMQIKFDVSEAKSTIKTTKGKKK